MTVQRKKRSTFWPHRLMQRDLAFYRVGMLLSGNSIFSWEVWGLRFELACFKVIDCLGDSHEQG
jgi:hypothetical protein